MIILLLLPGETVWNLHLEEEKTERVEKVRRLARQEKVEGEKASDVEEGRRKKERRLEIREKAKGRR